MRTVIALLCLFVSVGGHAETEAEESPNDPTLSVALSARASDELYRALSQLHSKDTYVERWTDPKTHKLIEEDGTAVVFTSERGEFDISCQSGTSETRPPHCQVIIDAESSPKKHPSVKKLGAKIYRVVLLNPKDVQTLGEGMGFKPFHSPQLDIRCQGKRCAIVLRGNSNDRKEN